MRKKLFNELCAFNFGDPLPPRSWILEMVHMVCHVQIPSSASLVDLQDLVPSEGEFVWVGIF